MHKLGERAIVVSRQVAHLALLCDHADKDRVGCLIRRIVKTRNRQLHRADNKKDE